MHMLYWNSLVLTTFSLFTICLVVPIELNADSVEATASLTFRLSQLIKKNRNPAKDISFSESDELALWNTILCDDSNNITLNQAYMDFQNGKSLEKEGKTERAILFYEKSFKALSNHWSNQKDNLNEKTLSKSCSAYNDFEINPYISHEARDLIRPFLLPWEHPMRSCMDEIFLSNRVIQDENTFQDAGFDILFTQPRSFIVVGRHQLLPGYLIKANLDTTLELKQNKPAWQWFVNRCVGVKKIRNIIKSYKMKYCVAPKKYIYPLPPEPFPQDLSLYSRKIVVLLVDDMQLVDKKTNKLYWKTVITKEHLKEVYKIISRANGKSYRAGNMPFTKNMKISFIDTEYPTSNPDFDSIRKYLNFKMREYWDHLVTKGK